MTSTKSATQKLEELILPSTPSAVRKKYLELAERAEHESFDVLEDDIVVLDTETTGLSFKKCSLIEENLPPIAEINVVEVTFPWNRLFESDILPDDRGFAHEFLERRK